MTAADFFEWVVSLTPYLTNGLVAGSVAIGVYVLKKHLESRGATRSATRILYNEISHNVRHLELKHVDTRYQIERCPPSMEVYLGLLRTGNIRYFDDVAQRKLNHLYCAFQVGRFDLFVLLISTLKDLEQSMSMSCANRLWNFLGAFRRKGSRK